MVGCIESLIDGKKERCATIRMSIPILARQLDFATRRLEKPLNFVEAFLLSSSILQLGKRASFTSRSSCRYPPASPKAEAPLYDPTRDP